MRYLFPLALLLVFVASCANEPESLSADEYEAACYPLWWDMAEPLEQEHEISQKESNGHVDDSEVTQALPRIKRERVEYEPVRLPDNDAVGRSTRDAEYCLSVEFRDGLCMTNGMYPIDEETLILWEAARQWWCGKYYGSENECPEHRAVHWINYSRLHE